MGVYFSTEASFGGHPGTQLPNSQEAVPWEMVTTIRKHFVFSHYNPEQQKAQDWLGFMTSRNTNGRRLGKYPK